MSAEITVFTPTYNRAYTLTRLYNSLISQTDKRFVWLVVDDGSTDQTKELFDSWIKEEKIKIKYFFQENSGKSMAHNRGVELTQTKLFTCVDSDDYLVPTAIEEILKAADNLSEENVGILSRKSEKEDDKSAFLTKDINQTTLKNAYAHLGLNGDTMLIFKTSVISKYSFPRFEGERFVPENYLYDLTDRDGKLLVLDKVLYIYEYLSDGYTTNMARLLKKNPQGYLAYINQRLKFDETLKEKVLDTVRYIAISIVKKDKSIIKNAVYPLIAFLTYPFGLLLYIKKFKKA